LNDNITLAVVGCLCITILAATAMIVTGHDGSILASSSAAIGAIIAGVVGYSYGKSKI